MNKFAFIVLIAQCTFLCHGHPQPEVATEIARKSMLGMLTKFIEINGTIIDEVMMSEGSTTESAFGRIWLNATERPSGVCEVEEEFTEIVIVERIPYDVEVEVWCWTSVRCTEWETHYREEKHKKNVTQTRLAKVLIFRGQFKYCVTNFYEQLNYLFLSCIIPNL